MHGVYGGTYCDGWEDSLVGCEKRVNHPEIRHCILKVLDQWCLFYIFS